MKSFFSSFFPSVFKQNDQQPQKQLNIQFSSSSDSLQVLLGNSFYVINLKPDYELSDKQQARIKNKAPEIEFKMESSSVPLSNLNFGSKLLGFSHLDRTQLIAVSFCEVNGSSYCVSLIDSYMKKEIKQLYFKDKVIRVKLLKSYLVISFETEVWVYNILPFQIKDTFITCSNPSGLFDVSQNFILVSYGSLQHSLRVQFIKADVVKEIQPFYQKRNLGNFCISKSGKLIAVSDQDGIQVKIIDSYSSAILKSLRRGLSPCKHSSLAFSINDSLFAMASQRKTIHVFSLTDIQEVKIQEIDARESILSKGLQILDDYVSPISLSSEKSSIKIRLEESTYQAHNYEISFSKELGSELLVRKKLKQIVTQEEGKMWRYRISTEKNEAQLMEMEVLNWKEFIGSGKWRTQAQEEKRLEQSQDWIYVKKGD